MTNLKKVNHLEVRINLTGSAKNLLVNQFLAAIMYADDLALLAPTRSSLQKLLDICHNYGIEWCITYNTKKTVVMVFGRQSEWYHENQLK